MRRWTDKDPVLHEKEIVVLDAELWNAIVQAVCLRDEPAGRRLRRISTRV